MLAIGIITIGAGSMFFMLGFFGVIENSLFLGLFSIFSGIIFIGFGSFKERLDKNIESNSKICLLLEKILQSKEVINGKKPDTKYCYKDGDCETIPRLIGEDNQAYWKRVSRS